MRGIFVTVAILVVIILTLFEQDKRVGSAEEGFTGGLASGNSRLKDDRSTAGERSLWAYSIWINAFIPNDIDVARTRPGSSGDTMITLSDEFKDKVRTAGGAVGSLVGPLGEIAGMAVAHKLVEGCYATDERSFSPERDASFRMQTTLEGDGKSYREHVYLGTICGETVLYDCKTGKRLASGVCKKGQGTELVIKNKRENMYEYSFRVKARNPVALVSSYIDYNADIVERWYDNRNELVIDVRGKVDEFPAFEMYANFNGTTKLLFSRYPDPGTGPEALIGGAKIEVKGYATFAYPNE